MFQRPIARCVPTLYTWLFRKHTLERKGQGQGVCGQFVVQIKRRKVERGNKNGRRRKEEMEIRALSSSSSSPLFLPNYRQRKTGAVSPSLLLPSCREGRRFHRIVIDDFSSLFVECSIAFRIWRISLFQNQTSVLLPLLWASCKLQCCKEEEREGVGKTLFYKGDCQTGGGGGSGC